LQSSEHQKCIEADSILSFSYGGGGYPQQGYPQQQYGGYNQGPPVGFQTSLRFARRSSSI